MLKTYRYRLYPTKSQVTLFERTLEICRWVYNDTLALRKNAWEREQRSVSLYETNKILTGWKREQPELKQVHSQVLQNVQMRIDLAFKAFFRRLMSGEQPGYPRFKGKGRYDSFTYPQSGFHLNESRLNLSKIGDVRVVLHRPIEGTNKALTIRRSATSTAERNHGRGRCRAGILRHALKRREDREPTVLPHRREGACESPEKTLESRERNP